MKKLMLVSLTLSLLTSTGTSFATTIPDTYLHPLDSNHSQRTADVIGTNSPFQVYGHEWVLPTQLKINVAWNSPTLGSNPPGYGGTNLKVGDVFLSYSGLTGHDPLTFHSESWNLAVALRTHWLSPEYGDGIKKGEIFFPTDGRLSDIYFPGSDHILYGENELVTASGYDSGQDVTIKYQKANGMGLDGFILIDFGGTGYAFPNGAPIRYTMTCANDVHVSDPVPEPATIFLIGSGLLGLAGLARRRFKK